MATTAGMKHPGRFHFFRFGIVIEFTPDKGDPLTPRKRYIIAGKSYIIHIWKEAQQAGVSNYATLFVKMLIKPQPVLQRIVFFL